MAPHGDDDGLYHPKDSLSAAVKSTAITGLAGLFAASIKNAMTKEKVGAWTVFTRGGSTIGTFGEYLPLLPNQSIDQSTDCEVLTAAVGGAYEFSKNAAANLRERDDFYNDAIGGFFGGAILGVTSMSDSFQKTRRASDSQSSYTHADHNQCKQPVECPAWSVTVPCSRS